MPTLPSFSGRRRLRDATDAELIESCLQGESDAWEALIKRYEALLFSVLVREGLSQSDAEDTFQEVCLILLRRLADLRDSSRLGPWLVLTAKREAWRVHRSRRHTLASEMGDPDGQMEAALAASSEPPNTPEDELLAIVDHHLVRQAMEHLPSRCRRLLTLLYCDDPPASYLDVSGQMGMAIGSIGPTRARCLERLLKALVAVEF